MKIKQITTFLKHKIQILLGNWYNADKPKKKLKTEADEKQRLAEKEAD